jgi:hypothetical protein
MRALIIFPKSKSEYRVGEPRGQDLTIMGHLQIEPYLRLSALICVQENDFKDLKILVNADKGGFSQMKN